MIKQFRKGIRVPAAEDFVQDDNHYKRIDDNGERMLYEVTPPNGNKYYEVVEHGHCYKASALRPSQTIKDGEEMYPMDEDFGGWAWCYSDLSLAKRCFNYHKPKAKPVE